MAAGPAADPLATKGLPDGLGWLCAAVEPVAGAVFVDDDLGWLGLRVVAADGLDHATVARGALVGDDHAPDRILLPATTVSPGLNGQASGQLQSVSTRGKAYRRRPSAGAAGTFP